MNINILNHVCSSTSDQISKDLEKAPHAYEEDLRTDFSFILQHLVFLSFPIVRTSDVFAHTCAPASLHLLSDPSFAERYETD